MVMRGILALFFAGAGFAHLLAPHELLKITPDWVPSASAVIFVTGFVELANASLEMRLTPNGQVQPQTGYRGYCQNGSRK
jgi:uncharacterized membrane protein